MTYVAQYFHAFSHLDKVETAGRRVERFAEVSLSVWEMRHSYEGRMKTVYPKHMVLIRSFLLILKTFGLNGMLPSLMELIQMLRINPRNSTTTSGQRKENTTQKRQIWSRCWEIFKRKSRHIVCGHILLLEVCNCRIWIVRGEHWQKLKLSIQKPSTERLERTALCRYSLIIGLRKVYGGRLQRKRMNSLFFWTQFLFRLPSLKVLWRTNMNKSAKSRMDFRQFKLF